MANSKIIILASIIFLFVCGTQNLNAPVAMNREVCSQIISDPAHPNYKEEPFFSICMQEQGLNAISRESK